jgi:LuxR family transcriptional regulator, maltose regulon positive regulatory protein
MSRSANTTDQLGDGIVERPALVTRLSIAARATYLCGLPGSGKTVLLRSWIAAAGIATRTAWVTVPRGTRDPRSFWRMVSDALRATETQAQWDSAQGSRADGWESLDRVLEGLSGQRERLWLVIDDLHELISDEALRQLGLLLLRAPETVRIVLATRRDVPVGLHRLRLAGDLTELRTEELRFTLEEARALCAASGANLSDSALKLLHERTEGWAAGLRLAAIALNGHPDPERFAAEFCGSERTVAEYLLAEVLDGQPEEVRQLLLRTAMLERVNGALADHLTGTSGNEALLQALTSANAFVFALDTERSWFRYHRLLADLLRSELRRRAPADVRRLQAAAAEWEAAHQGAQIIDFPRAAVARSVSGPSAQLLEALSHSESRVLRYLPTNLSRSEIAAQLYVSVNTVKTHMSRLFAKLGAHSRSQAVERARALGLIGNAPRQPAPRSVPAGPAGLPGQVMLRR